MVGDFVRKPSVLYIKETAFTSKVWNMHLYNLMLTKLSKETSTKKLLYDEKKAGRGGGVVAVTKNLRVRKNLST